MKFPFAKLLILFTFCFGIHIFTHAQSQRFLVKDHENLPMIGATIKLIALPDSTIKHSTTNNAGIAIFESVKNGLYEIQITYVGFETITKKISIKPERKTIDFKMSQQSVFLGEVAIVARRPLIRQEDDKTIIDPEPIAETSTNTLEILESTPGIYVDQDGGIFLSGAAPASVFINGREQKMSSQDITTLLQNLPPGSVQQIEILRTPSTKYDAASTGGILNIVLKKGVKIGRFMTLSAGMNQGKYGNQFLGYSLNNSGNKSTQYLNINYNYNDRLEELNSNRLIKTDTFLTQTAQNRNKRNQL
ncbi:MAG: carboxypeptidase-like regulatory domain-containing protein, partial [Bacteroidales bacterium]|nr:carboxypeptidase-like regulatory domain-containing protein [Bacteroidales bacterium]